MKGLYNGGMIKFSFNVEKKWIDFLRSHSSISVAEHIRRALDEYIHKYEDHTTSTSSSTSESTSPTIIHEDITETHYKEEGDSDDEEEK